MPRLGEEHTWFENEVWTIDADFCKQGEPIFYTDGTLLGWYDISQHEWWPTDLYHDGSWKSSALALTPTRHYVLPNRTVVKVEFFSYGG